MGQEYKYFAFISYSSSDIEWGKRLQRKLEGYRMPATLCSEHGWQRNPIKPVFFAPSDIQPGGLSAELQERLKASKNLIVICSPNSAKSEWVGKEIAFFHSLGRAKEIYFFIIDGIPHSADPDTECFNPVIETLGLPEILGANVHEKIHRWPWLNKERAYVQLITKLLGVEFDSIWQRHRRLLRQKIGACILGLIALVSALLFIWANSQPVDVTVSLEEASIHNDNLPPLKNAVVTMALDNEVKTDTLLSLDERALFANVPHRFLGKSVHLSVACTDWITIDTAFVLTRNVCMPIVRDERIYGDVSFRLWNNHNGKGVENTRVKIAGQEIVSDADGFVKLFVPLNNQSSQYRVECGKELECDILYMPTTESTVLVLK